MTDAVTTTTQPRDRSHLQSVALPRDVVDRLREITIVINRNRRAENLRPVGMHVAITEALDRSGIEAALGMEVQS